MKKITYIVIHHTAVSYRKNPKQWRATDNYHKAQGWGGGGYNYEIAADGEVHQFRKDGSPTAAQYQNNMNDGRAISICLDMNGDIESPTPEQYEACKKLILQKMEAYRIKPENIIPHRDLATYKSCPGKLLPDDLAKFFGVEPIIEKMPAQANPERPTGSPEKRASVLARIARQRLIQKALNLFTKEK